MLTHYNLVANAIQNAVWFGWSSRDIIIGLLPAYHSWGACTCVNSPIYAGARVVLIPRLDIEGLLMTIEREKATVLYGAASMFITLINNPLINKYDLSSLRYIKAGAMPMHTWLPTSGESAPVSVMALLPAAIDKLLGIYLLIIIVRQLFILNSAALSIIARLATRVIAIKARERRRSIGQFMVFPIGVHLGIAVQRTLPSGRPLRYQTVPFYSNETAATAMCGR